MRLRDGGKRSGLVVPIMWSLGFTRLVGDVTVVVSEKGKLLEVWGRKAKSNVAGSEFCIAWAATQVDDPRSNSFPLDSLDQVDRKAQSGYIVHVGYDGHSQFCAIRTDVSFGNYSMDVVSAARRGGQECEVSGGWQLALVCTQWWAGSGSRNIVTLLFVYVTKRYLSYRHNRDGGYQGSLRLGG